MSVTLEEALLLADTTAPQLATGGGIAGNGNGIGGNGMGGSCSSTGTGTGGAVAGGWRAAERNGALGDANVLRAHGSRLMVAEKNIGRPLYSFNALQRQFIPELYQPPSQTIQDVITSALNRDS